jgi:hypothetical protein
VEGGTDSVRKGRMRREIKKKKNKRVKTKKKKN